MIKRRRKIRINFFIRKKFSYCCVNDDEWYCLQEYLFEKGFKWEGYGKELLFDSWKYPKLLQNYRTGDRFGSRNLIISSIHSKNEKNFKSASKFLRNEKLKRINEKEANI